MIVTTHTATHTRVSVPGRFVVDVEDGDWLTLNLALTAAGHHARKARAEKARKYLRGFDIDENRRAR